jgi:hypothetical protein
VRLPVNKSSYRSVETGFQRSCGPSL